jgi:hypothetical protein
MLSTLLAPLPIERFFAEFWTKQFVHIPGQRDKFTHLFPWNVLNDVLEQQHFQPNRLSLVKAGKRLDASRYLDRERVNANVDARALMAELANGATLILNWCDEAHPPLREVCVYLERMFHVHVQANLYAGWRADNGFDVHWDEQDNLVLQVAGRKRWKVWRPTRLYPFRRDAADTSSKTKPDEEPFWEGTLQQGDLLHVPRGWWHVAYPMDEPCLHLTVTVNSLTGIDLLKWFAHQMKSSEIARTALPIVASIDERRVWLDALWRDISESWAPNMTERYLADIDVRARARPALRLPELNPPST